MSERLPVAPQPEQLPDLRKADIVVISRGTPVVRVHRRGGAHPMQWSEFRHFGPTTARGRFDHHLTPPRTQERGILYGAAAWKRHAGAAGTTAVAEAFQDTRTIERDRDDPAVTTFRLSRAVRLLDLTSGWITRAGGNQAISSGERTRSRSWARSVYSRYEDIDGLYYAAATYGPGRAVALFERARNAIPTHPSAHRALVEAALAGFLGRAADELGYFLA